MRAELVDPVTEPIPKSWETFVSANCLPFPWHGSALACAAWSGRAASVLCPVTDGDRPAALFFGRLQGASDPRRYHEPGAAAPGVLECRTYPGSQTGFVFDRDLDSAGRAAAVAAFEAAVRRRFGWRVAGVVYRHVAGAHLDAVRAGRRFVRAVEPEAVLPNQWADAAQYRAALPGKWRSQLRRIQADVAADPDLTVQLCKTVPVRDAARLVHQIRYRHRPRWLIQPPVSESYLQLYNDDPGTEFVCYLTGERLVAFSTLHDTGTELYMSHWGSRDRTDGGRQNIYFDQFLRVIDLMIERGRAATMLGKGMPVIKARFAAALEPRYLVAGR